MFTEFKLYSVLLFCVPAALAVTLMGKIPVLSTIEWVNAFIYAVLCLAGGILLWLSKKTGFWLAVVCYGLASVALQLGENYFAAVYFLPSLNFKFGTAAFDVPRYIEFSWLPLGIFLYLLFGGRRKFNSKHNKALNSQPSAAGSPQSGAH